MFVVIHDCSPFDCSPLAVRANECDTYAASRATETGLRVDQPRVYDPRFLGTASYELYAPLRFATLAWLELPSVLQHASGNAVDAKRGELNPLKFHT